MISCDSDFDLSNINTDITVGGSIAAPIGATDTLTLSRLIDLTDNLKVEWSVCSYVQRLNSA